MADFEAGAEFQNSLGVANRMIGPAEAQRLCPYISTDGLVVAACSPADGPARPELVVGGYAEAAVRAGTSCTQTAVAGIDTSGDHVTGVHTSRGRIACCAVVCTAVARSGLIAASWSV